MDKLKDCPFCGGEASKPVRSSGSDERNGYNFTVSIFCKCCRVSIRCDSATDAAGWCKDTGQALENAVSAWNRRAAPAQGDGKPVATKCAACNGEGWVRDIHDMEQGRIRCTKCATRQSSADAVDAARAVVDAWDKCNGYPDTNMEISAIGNAVDALRASIAAQGGKGGAG